MSRTPGDWMVRRAHRTPGDWMVRGTHETLLKVISEECPKPHRIKTSTVALVGGNGQEEIQSNARLVAAAPRLLEALRRADEAMAAMDLWPGWGDADYTQADVRHQLIQCLNSSRAALAEVEGVDAGGRAEAAVSLTVSELRALLTAANCIADEEALHEVFETTDEYNTFVRARRRALSALAASQDVEGR